MPNDCYNVLILRHSNRAKLTEACTAYKRAKLLDYFCPQPNFEDVVGKPADIRWVGYSLRYVWRNRHWGTKCDIYDHDGYLLSQDTLRLAFSTAWGPPLRAYDAAVENHGFQVEAHYNEPGMCFRGRYISQESVDDCFEYGPDADLPQTVKEIFTQLRPWLEDPTQILEQQEMGGC